MEIDVKVFLWLSYFPNQLYNGFPCIMKYLPGPHQKIFRNWGKLKLFVSHIVKKHEKDWNPDEPRDFIDAFLIEMQKVRNVLPVSSSYRNVGHLITKVLDNIPCIYSALTLCVDVFLSRSRSGKLILSAAPVSRTHLSV
jgi:hypothetical protein